MIPSDLDWVVVKMVIMKDFESLVHGSSPCDPAILRKDAGVVNGTVC